MPTARFRLRIDCEAITGQGTQGGGTGMIVTGQDPLGMTHGATVVPITSSQPQAVVTTGFGGENVGNGRFPSAQDVLNVMALKWFPLDPSKKKDFNDFIQRLKEVQKVLTTPNLGKESRACPENSSKSPGKRETETIIHYMPSKKDSAIRYLSLFYLNKRKTVGNCNYRREN